MDYAPWDETTSDPVPSDIPVVLYRHEHDRFAFVPVGTQAQYDRCFTWEELINLKDIASTFVPRVARNLAELPPMDF